MAELLTTGNIMFGLGILGVIFTVFNYFKNPQIAEDKKASLLAQQVQWQKEANETRFSEMEQRITDAMTLAQNHIHTIDIKVDMLATAIGAMGIDVAKLSTIIEERIPKK